MLGNCYNSWLLLLLLFFLFFFTALIVVSLTGIVTFDNNNIDNANYIKCNTS